jgi:hypothetical protein
LAEEGGDDHSGNLSEKSDRKKLSFLSKKKKNEREISSSDLHQKK